VRVLTIRTHSAPICTNSLSRKLHLLGDKMADMEALLRGIAQPELFVMRCREHARGSDLPMNAPVGARPS